MDTAELHGEAQLKFGICVGPCNDPLAPKFANAQMKPGPKSVVPDMSTLILLCMLMDVQEPRMSYANSMTSACASAFALDPIVFHFPSVSSQFL